MIAEERAVYGGTLFALCNFFSLISTRRGRGLKWSPLGRNNATDSVYNMDATEREREYLSLLDVISLFLSSSTIHTYTHTPFTMDTLYSFRLYHVCVYTVSSIITMMALYIWSISNSLYLSLYYLSFFLPFIYVWRRLFCLGCNSVHAVKYIYIHTHTHTHTHILRILFYDYHIFSFYICSLPLWCLRFTAARVVSIESHLHHSAGRTYAVI